MISSSIRASQGVEGVFCWGYHWWLNPLERNTLRLLVGSGEQYGPTAPGAPPVAEDTPLEPGSVYALAKTAADLAGELAARRGQDVLRVRPFNHTGVGQRDVFVAPEFARQVAEIEAGRRARRSQRLISSEVPLSPPSTQPRYAEVEHPAQQGLVQAFSVYIDTLFICTATAFMILITDSYNVISSVPSEFLIHNLVENPDPNSPAFTQIAVDSVFSGIGKPFVALALFFFSFTTLLAYYYIAENNVTYIQRSLKIPKLTLLLKVAIIIAVFYGTIKNANLSWGLGDIGVGLMAWLNIVAIIIIFFIAKPSIKALKDYEEQKARQKDSVIKQYSFDPEKLGIKGADFWLDKKRKEDATNKHN